MAQTVEILSDAQIRENLSHYLNIDGTIRFLYQAHFETLSRYITNNSGTWQDAEDIFQEVIVMFIRLVQQDKFRGESTIKTFLYALTKNMWLNELKRRGRASKREEQYEIKNLPEGESINRSIDSREAHQYLMQTMDNLGEGCKKILLLYYYENYSMKDIVTQTGYENEQVVRNKKYKCLKKLGDLMTKDPKMFHQLKNLLNA